MREGEDKAQGGGGGVGEGRERKELWYFKAFSEEPSSHVCLFVCLCMTNSQGKRATYKNI